MAVNRGGGISRLIRLILDKASAEKLRREAQEALVKGTDPRKPEQNLGRIRRGLTSLKGMIVAVGAAIGAAFVARKIVQFGKESVRVATESGLVWNRLAGQLKAVGVDFGTVEGRIRSLARELQDFTAFGDEDTAQVLTELIGITGDLGSSMANVELVFDLATAKQIDFKTAAQLVGRVMVGETGTLKRYGIVVEEGADALETMRERFRGIARNEATTFGGKLKQLNNEWGDFKEAVGQAMIEAGSGTSVLDTLIGTVKGLTIWVERNANVVAAWANVFVQGLGAIWQQFRFVIGVAGVFGDVLGGIVSAAIRVARGDFAGARRELGLVGESARGLTDDAKKVGEEWKDVGRALIAALRTEPIDKATEAVGVLESGVRQVGETAEQTEARLKKMREALLRNLEMQPGAGSFPGGIRQRLTGDRLVGPGADPFAAQMPLAGLTEAVQGVEPLVGEVTAAIHPLFQELQDNASRTGSIMTDAFEDFFVALSRATSGGAADMQNFADAAKGVGASIVRSMTEGAAEWQTAEGVADLAAGIWPPNPAAIAASAQHFAAAGLFRALGSLVGGAGGGSRGGGGMMDMPRGSADVRTTTSGPAPAPLVQVFLDPLDPHSPAWQRTFRATDAYVRDKFGGKGVIEPQRITHHSRNLGPRRPPVIGG